MNSNYIQHTVQAHYDAIVEMMGSTRAVLGAFAYGSMNYGLFIPGISDVDTKVIVVPSLDNCIFDRPISKDTSIDDTVCTVKDIRLIVNNYKKQSINFIETLFTPYFVLNPLYEDIFQQYFLDHREAIARYDVYTAFKNACYYCKKHLDKLFKMYVIDNKTDNKTYVTVMRLLDFISRYFKGTESYEDCLIPKRVQELRDIRLNPSSTYSFDELQKLQTIFHFYFSKIDSLRPIKKIYNLDSFLDMGIKRLIYKRADILHS